MIDRNTATNTGGILMLSSIQAANLIAVPTYAAGLIKSLAVDTENIIPIRPLAERSTLNCEYASGVYNYTLQVVYAESQVPNVYMFERKYISGKRLYIYTDMRGRQFLLGDGISYPHVAFSHTSGERMAHLPHFVLNISWRSRLPVAQVLAYESVPPNAILDTLSDPILDTYGDFILDTY
jgi:hypothetical protein